MSLTKKQLETRKAGISASDVAAILGLNPYRRPINVWQDKLTPVEDREEVESQELGHFFEKHIAEYYATKYAPDGHWRRLYMPRKTLVHPRLDWVMATPDRFVFEMPETINKSDLSHLKDLATAGEASHLAEIKLVGPYAVKDWLAEVEPGATVEQVDRVPTYVFCQCQWQMLVTAYERVDVPALLGGTKLRVFEIKRDQEFIDDALTICEDFRKKYILTGAEPPPDGSNKYRSYLSEKFPGQVNSELLEAPTYVEGLAIEYARVDASIKALKERKEKLAQMVKVVIGDNDGITGPWGKATWRLGRGRVSYADIVKDQKIPAETIDNYRTPGRTFRVTVRKEYLDEE